MEGHRGWVWSIASVSLAGRAMALSGGEDGTLRLWDLQGQRQGIFVHATQSFIEIETDPEMRDASSSSSGQPAMHANEAQNPWNFAYRPQGHCLLSLRQYCDNETITAAKLRVAPRSGPPCRGETW
jgi:WD40 repeat protein